MNIYNCGMKRNYNKPTIYFNLDGGDNRYLKFTYISSKFIYSQGFKITISIHNKFFYYKKYYNEFRITLFWINAHFIKK